MGEPAGAHSGDRSKEPGADDVMSNHVVVTSLPGGHLGKKFLVT